MTIEFFVPCLPVAQPRPRAGKSFSGHAVMYQAKATHPIHTFKTAIVSQWHLAGATKLEGPLKAELQFLFERPAKVPKKLGTGRIDKQTKPDLDNLAKGVLDALNKLAYHDDGQVCELKISKQHAAQDETPGVLITIKEIE